MSDGIYIESQALTAEQASALLSVLASAQIPVGAAVNALALRLALERIVNGVDKIVNANDEEK